MPKILIVEDNDLNLKLFYDIIRTLEHNLITCKNGKEVITLVNIEKPELILMDIKLQEVSGIDLIKILKSQPCTKHIPIIAITAFAMKNDRIRIMQSGCDFYIAKPISLDSFLNTIKLYFPYQ